VGDRAAVAGEVERLAAAARIAAGAGLEVHAGHGLTYETVGAVAAMPQLVELNIGHFLVGEAIFIGLEGAVRRMRELMDEGRMGIAERRSAHAT
jgi:pyridoxine 5-phosphate synthase